MSSLKSHEHLGVCFHFVQKCKNGICVGEWETPKKQGETTHFLASIP